MEALKMIHDYNNYIKEYNTLKKYNIIKKKIITNKMKSLRQLIIDTDIYELSDAIVNYTCGDIKKFKKDNYEIKISNGYIHFKYISLGYTVRYCSRFNRFDIFSEKYNFSINNKYYPPNNLLNKWKYEIKPTIYNDLIYIIENL